MTGSTCGTGLGAGGTGAGLTSTVTVAVPTESIKVKTCGRGSFNINGIGELDPVKLGCKS